MRRILSLLALLCTLLFMGCGESPMAGGAGGETTNGIAGIIRNGGAPAAGVFVTLYPENFNPVTAEVPGSMRDVTDSGGAYLFKRLAAGAYNVQAFSPEAHTAVLLTGISISAKADTVLSGQDGKLAPAGEITLYLQERDVEEGGHVYVPGTGISAVIQPADIEAGHVLLTDIPASVYASVRYAGAGGVLETELLKDGIDLMPGGKAVVGPWHAWENAARIVVNTSPSGADITGSLLHYPLLVRLNTAGAQAAASERLLGASLPDGSDLRIAKADGITPLPFEIERWDPAGGAAEIWVRMDTVLGGSDSQFIYAYTGFPEASSLSTGSGVFGTDNGFAGVWHLNESPGGADTAGIIRDRTPNGNHGTVHGGMAAGGAADGITGAGLPFDGVDDYISIPHHASLSFTGSEQFTLSIWAKVAAPLDSEAGLMTKGIEWGGENYSIDLLHPGVGFRAYIWKPDTTFGFNAVSPDAPGAGWNHITAAFDGRSFLDLYINGVLKSEVPLAVDSIITNTRDLLIGSRESETGVDLNFRGSLDEARIVRGLRSKDWIKMNFESQKEASAAVRVE